MTYCKKCSRILDDDTNVCPYCGAVDSPDGGSDVFTSTNLPTDIQLSDDPPTDIFPSDILPTENPPDSIGASTDAELDELNKLIEKNKKQPEIIYPDQPVNNDNRPIRPEIIDAPGTEKGFDPVLRVILIALTALFPFVGLIVAIILMSSGTESYRALGKILLIISLIECFLGILCCCGIGLLSSAAYS